MISLIKGQNTALDSNLKKVVVGLGWDPRQDAGAEFDLDASAFMLGANGKVRSDGDFVFFNQLKSQCGSVEHMGDNLTGGGEGDDEQIVVDLPNVPSDVEKIVFVVTIYKVKERNQNFGMVENAFIRIVDAEQDVELARFELSEDACISEALVFGELYRRNGAWKFRALGQGFDYEIGDFAKKYGVNV